MLNIEMDIGNLYERLQILQNKLEHVDWSDITELMLKSVFTNFEVHGRPTWQPGMNPMIKDVMTGKGKLRNTYIVTRTDDSMTITWTTPYAKVHQSIATARPKVTQKSHNFFISRLIRARQDKTPDKDMWESLVSKEIGDTINTPERRFAMFQDEDKKGIKQLFIKQLEG